MFIKDLKEVSFGYNQKWRYAPLPYGSVSTNRILEYCRHGVITKKEVAIMQYLSHFKAAPVSMLKSSIPLLKDDEESTIKEKMEVLVRDRILNSFVLTDEYPDDVKYDRDALTFYTLDHGGQTILKSVCNSELLNQWNPADALMSSVKVKKLIMIEKLYDRLLSECDISYIRTKVRYGASDAQFVPNFEFAFEEEADEEGRKYKTYLIEALCNEDIEQRSDTEFFNKIVRYSKLLNNQSNAWKHFFPQSVTIPSLIVLCDDIRCANIMSRQIDELPLSNVRYLIMDKDKPLSLCFYKYADNALHNVKAVAFSKK